MSKAGKFRKKSKKTKAKKKTKVEDELTRPDVGDWND